jgi:hypothetical protein
MDRKIGTYSFRPIPILQGGCVSENSAISPYGKLEMRLRCPATGKEIDLENPFLYN